MQLDSYYYALTFVSSDKPGIVASITDVLYRSGFNIADSSSTLLHGVFSMIFIVSNEKDMSDDDVKGLFKNSGYLPYVYRVNKSYEHAEGEQYSVSISGADKPGIVSKITSLLADLGINIADLQTKVIGKEGSFVYLMILEISVPTNVDPSWQEELSKLAKAVSVNVKVSPIDSYEF